MPIVVVDKDGKPLPASGLVFGDGYRVENLGNGIVRIEVSGSIEVTKVVTAEKGVTRWLTTTRQISAERVTDVTVTQFLTKDREYTVERIVGTLTHDKIVGKTRIVEATRDAGELTHDKYGATVTNGTVTKDRTVTKTYYVTK